MRRDSIRSTSSIMSGSVNEEQQQDNDNNGGDTTGEEEEKVMPGASSMEEEEEEEDLAVEGTVPVGITIAYRHQQKGFDEKMLRTAGASSSSPANDSNMLAKKKKHRSSSSSPNSTKKATSSKKKAEESNHEKTKKGSTSFQVFLESAAIYFLCLVLPTALGYLYSWYDIWRYERETEGRLSEEDDYYSSYYEYLFNYQWFMRSVYDPVESFMCDDGGSDSSYSWSLVSSVIAKTGLCAGSELDSVNQKRSVLSDDVSAGNDVVTIAVCSCLLAIIRIGIVQYTVPMEDADKVEAMVRVKSDHFLRSNYMLTPAGTPMQKKTIKHIPDLSQAGLHLPSLNDPVSNEAPEDDMFGVHIDASEREDDPATSLLQTQTAGNQGKNFIQSIPIQKDSASDSLVDHGASPPPIPAANPVSGRNKKRLYAAPRYATALFRLLYSTVTVAIALIYFRGADFWPWYVLGHGSTVKCWDLSGGMSVGMDSDFDQRNAVLKRFFLWQASYHWHSGAFHILSLLILLLHPTKHAPRRFLSFQTSSTAYVRSLGQHVASVALIAVAYVFSSLRRLVAIGMFAFDVSSWFLHLLQVCINAPEDSRLRRREIVSRVYWYLVIPSFVVARFMIWPAIWYSAAFESSFWLKQLEKTLWPGSAVQLRTIIHFFMGILLSFSVVYFRRLLTHPQLQALLKEHKGGLA